MLSRLRNRFGTAGLVVAVIALIAALAGGAYAASGALTGKQKKEVEKIAKRFAGKPGATGPAGPAGSAGAPGKDGSNGTNGSNGVSVTTAGANTTECPSGGIKVMSASAPAKVCNGTTGFTDTLPSEKSETGVWAVGQTGVVPADSENPPLAFAPISFAIPLAEGVDVTYVIPGGEPSTECPGTIEFPEAAPGNLCVYAYAKFGTELIEEQAPEGEGNESGGGTPGIGTSKSGVLLVFKMSSATASARGTWIVTAP